MTDIDLTAAEKEAARRWPGIGRGEQMAMHDRHVRAGFEEGAKWALAQVEARVKPSREDVIEAIRSLNYPSGPLVNSITEYVAGLAADAALALLPGKTEQEVRADALDWAAEHLSDGLQYEDIAQINSWEAVTACAGVLCKKAQEARGGEGR